MPDDLTQRGVNFRSLTEAIDTDTATEHARSRGIESPRRGLEQAVINARVL